MNPIPANALAALRWIVAILKQESIPFQIGGGLAARFYGATRPLADIDLSVPAEALAHLVPGVKGHLVYGPSHYVDANWDLELMTLRWNGQEIDLCAAVCRIFDKEAGRWIPLISDLQRSEYFSVEELTVPVEPKASLIAYKKTLGREVDLADVEELEARS